MLRLNEKLIRRTRPNDCTSTNSISVKMNYVLSNKHTHTEIDTRLDEFDWNVEWEHPAGVQVKHQPLFGFFSLAMNEFA